MYTVKLESGQWYLVSHCTRCQTVIPIFHDLSNGESELNGNYSLTCPRCNHSGVYKVEHYQHHDRRKPDILIEIL
jgi:hypothetical protein